MGFLWKIAGGAGTRGNLGSEAVVFCSNTGRRRIGKTALIQEGLRRSGLNRTLYIQIPDSDSIGVLTACNLRGQALILDI
jgi:hypothetical protein